LRLRENSSFQWWRFPGAGQDRIRILAPVIGVRGKKVSGAEKDVRIQNQEVLVGVRSAYLIDVYQTERKDR
ncbi:MAG TPA: DUF1738 domain-containing protein, partial [Acidobacteriaceae bacterium]